MKTKTGGDLAEFAAFVELNLGKSDFIRRTSYLQFAIEDKSFRTSVIRAFNVAKYHFNRLDGKRFLKFTREYTRKRRKAVLAFWRKLSAASQSLEARRIPTRDYQLEAFDLYVRALRESYGLSLIIDDS